MFEVRSKPFQEYFPQVPLKATFSGRQLSSKINSTKSSLSLFDILNFHYELTKNYAECVILDLIQIIIQEVPMNFELLPLNDEHLTQYKKDMQEAFQQGAAKEITDNEEEILPC